MGLERRVGLGYGAGEEDRSGIYGAGEEGRSGRYGAGEEVI